MDWDKFDKIMESIIRFFIWVAIILILINLTVEFFSWLVAL